MEYLITVIVPVYNVEKYLSKCLDSLINQTFKPLKILVINDESSDSSFDIIQNYKNQYPDKIDVIDQKNHGIAYVRNVGIKNVNTKYLAFLDSDDYIDLDMYEKMYNKAQQNDSDMVVSNFVWEYSDKEKLGLDGPYLPHQDMLVKLMATLWNKLYKTSVIEKSGVLFPNGLRYEDAYFLYCLTPFINKIDFIDTPFVHYVQRDGSITHNHNDKVKDMISVFEQILVFYKENNLYDEYYDELEYLFVKFFLGNSFLRTVKIKDKNERNITLNLSWEILIKNFPNYSKNKYFKILGGNKNRYFSIVKKWNYKILAALFGVVTRR